LRYHAANRFQTRLTASVDESQIYFEVESTNGCPEVPFKLTVGTEIVDVIGVVGNTFTVQRGAEGTTPQSHPEGAVVQNRWTAGTYEDLWDDVEKLQGAMIVDSGSTDYYGSWVRWSNGLQICWIPSITLVYINPGRLDAQWTFPAGFKTGSRPACIATPNQLPPVYEARTAGTVVACTESYCTVIAVAPLDTFGESDTWNFQAVAIGWWK
jgi:hypothetical protein